MRVKVYDQQAKEIGTALLPKGIFEVPINPDLVHQAVIAQEANARVARAKTKGRGEVRGGGRKPWRQKGTGRARHGSIRSPLWRGGGKAHGPKGEKIYAKKINKKAKHKALRMALSVKAQDKAIFVIAPIEIEKGKTKEVKAMVEKFSALTNTKHPTFLIMTVTNDQKFIRAAKNIPYVATIGVQSLNVRDILSRKFLLLPKEAIKVIQDTYSKADN